MTKFEMNVFNDMVKNYIDVDKESPYNNRRNRLRKIADWMFGEMSPEARIKCDEAIIELGLTRLEELKIKPNFNSFRGRLSPAVLEQLVIHAAYSLNKDINLDKLTETKRTVSRHTSVFHIASHQSVSSNSIPMQILWTFTQFRYKISDGCDAMEFQLDGLHFRGLLGL